MAKREGSLNVLIITGAGASTNLGADDEPIPMMAGWAGDLSPRLGYVGRQLGLTEATNGPDFEAIIGRFLTFSKSLELVNDMSFLGNAYNLIAKQGRQDSNANFAAWYNATQNNIPAINGVLWESLWQNFGRPRIDSDKAKNAYGALHDLIRASRDDGPNGCYIAHATTNFDPAIEIAVEESTYPNTELLDGFSKVSGNARRRWAPNLLTANRLDSDGRIPVVHIHGAVGWYYDPDDNSRILLQPSDDNYDPSRSPALLLPDATKRPDTFPAPLVQVWDQLQKLLREATHIFVIGHSLHDAYLVDAIKVAEKPTAVMTMGKPTVRAGQSKPLGHPSSLRITQWDVDDAREVQRLQKAIPGAVVIPGEFGRGGDDPDFDTDAFTKWLDRN